MQYVLGIKTYENKSNKTLISGIINDALIKDELIEQKIVLSVKKYASDNRYTILFLRLHIRL